MQSNQGVLIDGVDADDDDESAETEAGQAREPERFWPSLTNQETTGGDRPEPRDGEGRGHRIGNTDRHAKHQAPEACTEEVGCVQRPDPCGKSC